MWSADCTRPSFPIWMWKCLLRSSQVSNFVKLGNRTAILGVCFSWNYALVRRLHEENRNSQIRCSGSTSYDLYGATRRCSRQYPPAPRICSSEWTGIDSVVGSIARKGGLVIEYDIGRLAGVYTDCKDCGWTNGELWRRNQVIRGHEVKIVFTKSKRLVISFPDAHANFYATIRSDADLTDALWMVLTYNPS